ncbi:MAG: hypothetical protein II532_02390, partial [Bacteroidales bacterium]|nr:hypothetical protein [Bacteroidales bacterium]
MNRHLHRDRFHCLQLLLVAVLLLSSFVSFSQTTINVPSTGTNQTTIISGQTLTVLDPGGNSNYPNSCSGSLVITAPDNAIINVSGSYNTESGWDYLYLTDGYGVTQSYTGTGSVSTTSQSNTLTVTFSSDGSISRTGFSLTVTCTVLCPYIYDITTSSETHSATISWQDSSNATQWTVNYGLSIDNLNQSISTGATSVTINNLPEHTRYYFSINSNGGNCTTRKMNFRTQCEGISLCQDFTDLTSCKVTCTYGTFANPEMHEGQVNGRHTVITSNGYDSYTYGGLRKIPTGETASIRLGNSSTGSQAESIIYEYTVDTTINDLLLLRYAAVLENPTHSASDQPRFKFDILDDNMMPVNSNCYSADFVSSYALGWNSGSGSVLWKDWTPVAVDLAPMHGQTIYVKLTTYDCNHSGHFGYAYFTLNCTHKVVSSTNCGNTVANVFSAPSGFTYRWYNENNPSVTLSSSQSLSVSDSGVYCCSMNMVGSTGTDCSLVMKAVAGYRYPYAQFSSQLVDTADCLIGYQFTNNSVISSDAEHTRLTSQPCEGLEWDFGDGETSTERNPLHYFSSGTHHVRLIATLSNGACQDTTYETIVVTSPCDINDTVYDTICHGSSFTLFDTVVSDAGVYERNSGWTHRTLFLSVEQVNDTTVFDTIVENQLPHTYAGQSFTEAVSDYAIPQTSPRGCSSTLSYNLYIHSNISQSFDTTLCSAQFPFEWHGQLFEDTCHRQLSLLGQHGEDSIVGFTVSAWYETVTSVFDTIVENQLPWTFASEVYNDSVASDSIVLTDIHGCDSLIVYSLHVWSNVTTYVDTTICDNAFPFIWGQHTLTSAGVDSTLLTGVHGNDSVVVLTLSLFPTYSQTTPAAICDDSSYVFFGQTLTQSGFYTDTLVSIHQCDSVINLQLTVHPTFSQTTPAAICDNATFAFFGQELSASGFYTDTLISVHQCDSVVNIQLSVHPTYSQTLEATICDNNPYLFHGRTLVQTGFYSDTLTSVHQCDSVVNLQLTVHPTYSQTTAAAICDDSSYVFFGQTLMLSGSYSHTLATMHQCDSVIHLQLTVHPTYSRTVLAEICDNGTYTFQGEELTLSGFYTDTLTSLHQCDSVVNLQLTVQPTYYANMDETLCQNESFPLGGNEFTQSGNYHVEMQSVHGCDSIV